MSENKALLERGLKKLNEIGGKATDEVITALNDVAPDLVTYIGLAFDEIYSRPHLNARQRELITLTALTAQGGCENQLKLHIQAALNVGLSREEIIETFIQCIPYLGFPKGLNAIFVAKEIFSEMTE